MEFEKNSTSEITKSIENYKEGCTEKLSKRIVVALFNQMWHIIYTLKGLGMHFFAIK